MNNLTVFEHQGRTISQREDGYINLTQMCKANGKKLNHYLSLKSTIAYLEQVSSDTGITASQLIDVKKGNSSEFIQGSWGHKLIAVNLARWISPKFAVWCDAHIFNLMSSGQTSLEIDPIQEMKLKIELARLEAIKAKAEEKTLNLRHYVVTALPEPTQQKILGYELVEKVVEKLRNLIADIS